MLTVRSGNSARPCVFFAGFAREVLEAKLLRIKFDVHNFEGFAKSAIRSSAGGFHPNEEVAIGYRATGEAACIAHLYKTTKCSA
jgi:hypothetical protein